MLTITLLGTGSPIPSPDRAGPATLISGGDEHYLVDAGRGVLMRLAALGLGATNLSIVLLTHLHSDHITDLNDVIEVTDGPIDHPGDVSISCALTDHKPVEPSLGFRFELAGGSVVTAGDTVPCVGLDGLCDGADALVHTVIRKDIIENIPFQRVQDTLDHHSSPGEAAQTAARAGMSTLVLTHYVPPIPTGGDGADWKALAAEHFSGTIELGDDLHRIDVKGS
jgi:ribonuclease Z